MASPNDPSSRLGANKADVLKDTRPERAQYAAKLSEKLGELKAVHTKELQGLQLKHGQDLQRIFKECADEPEGLRELRIRSCTNRYGRERDALTDVHGRMELYREVKSKQDFEARFPGHGYPSQKAENLLEQRAKNLESREQEPGADHLHLYQEKEHDLLVKSHIEGYKDYGEFSREYNQMTDRHLAGSIPVHEKQLELPKHEVKPPAPDKD